MVDLSELITTLTAIFIAAAIMLYISKRLSQPAIPGYIIAGIIIGAFISHKDLYGLAQLGIAFLVFVFGLKFDTEKLREVGKRVVAVNSVYISFIGFISFVFAYFIGLGILQSAYFSVISTLSSSLVGLDLVSDEIDKNLTHGRLAEAVHLNQDIFAVLAILVLTSPAFTPYSVLRSLGTGSTIIILGFVIRKFFFGWVGRQSEGSPELLMFAALSSLAGFMYLASYLEVSPIIGSFAAGIAVARFPHNIEVLETIGPIKDFFSAIFFVVLGTLVSVPSIEVIALSLSIIYLTVFVKPLLLASSFLELGYDSRTAFMSSVTLDQVSEFSLIIAIQGFLAGVLIEPLFQAAVLAATITMISSSYTKLYEQRLYSIIKGEWFFTTERVHIPDKNFGDEKNDHIVMVGYDVLGKEIAEFFEEGEEFVVIENDPEKVSELEDENIPYVYGDVMNRETWEYAKFHTASLIVSTAPFKEVSEEILELETPADKILRSGKLEEAERFIEEGAMYVIVPEIITSEVLKEHILRETVDKKYLKELRRKNLLEVRRYLERE
ncbi:MAG: cation:proton antiporter [Candidatus Nanohaloarchaeota archaeon QJJ-9]|nr:cation:proton antiporter [Candidatus Nanohaloarchaeota archaeon QJJ-9]